MEPIGYVMSRSTHDRILFVIKRGSRVGIGSFCTTRHPWYEDAVVMLRVNRIYSMNEEMDIGRTALIASSLGFDSNYQSELEYLVAECEVLGYKRVGDEKLFWLESPPMTSSPVYMADKEDIRRFFSGERYGRASVEIGRIKGTEIPFYLDLDSIARGHLFVTGMTRSGKSVSGDTLIVVYDVERSDISIVRIDSLCSGKHDIVELEPHRYFTVSLDLGMMKAVWMPIKAVIRHRNSARMVEIVTENGRKIRMTPDHSLYVWDGSKIRLISPKDMRKGSYWVIVPKGIEVPADRRVDPALAELMGMAIADGEVHGNEVFIYSNDPEIFLVAESAGVEYRRLERGLELRDELLKEAVSKGFPYILSLDNQPMGIFGIRGAMGKALEGYFSRTSWIDDANSLFRRYYDPTARSKRVGIALSLLGVPTFNHTPRGFLIWEPSLRIHVENLAAEMYVPRCVPDLKRRIKGGLIFERRRYEEIVRRVSSAEADPRSEEKAIVDLYLKMIRSKVDFDRIVEIREVEGDSYVYDLSVPGTENFLANGIFVHNSSFAINLVKRSLNMNPRFLILDRRGEYEGLERVGAKIFEYRRFIPSSELLKAEDVARKLRISRGSSVWRLLSLVVEEIAAENLPLDGSTLMRKAKEIVAEMGGKNRQSLIELDARVRRFGKDLISYEEQLDIVKEVEGNNITVVDYSIDANYEDQFIATRDMIRRLLKHAVDSRKKGNFALIVLVEEAQYFAPERNAPIVGDPYNTGVAQALVEAISQSGGYNMGFVVISQRPAYLSKSLISQCNTVAAFRLRNGNDQDAIIRYTEGGDFVGSYLPGLDNNEAVIWGMASSIPFPVHVEIYTDIFPEKASLLPSEVWSRGKLMP